MESIVCVQGQAEGSNRQLVLVPISEGIPQDVLQSFRVQWSQGEDQPLLLAPAWEQSIPLFSGELRGFLPVTLGGLDLSSMERNLSGCLVESLVSGCQEIGLVAFMFFFELLFSYVSSSISFYVSFANLFSIILFRYLLITRDTQGEGEARF